MPVLAGAPHPYRSLSPYLVTPTPQAVVDFAGKVLGATEVEPAIRWPDGTIAHVALAIGDSVLMVGCTEARDQTQTAMLHVYVGDCDATYAAALVHGAESVQAPVEKGDGDRRAGVRDAAGNLWYFGARTGS
jgi:uncharacterized glyoxalase superfamily protein PhnB